MMNEFLTFMFRRFRLFRTIYPNARITNLDKEMLAFDVDDSANNGFKVYLERNGGYEMTIEAAGRVPREDGIPARWDTGSVAEKAHLSEEVVDEVLRSGVPPAVFRHIDMIREGEDWTANSDFSGRRVKIVVLGIDGVNHTVSVIRVPPSIDKPHVVKKYKKQQNYIPIRKNTGTHPAGRSDLEMMFYDRRNVQPEFALEVVLYDDRIAFNTVSEKIAVNLSFLVQSVGSRDVAVLKAKLLVFDQDGKPKIELDAQSWRADSTKKAFPRPLLVPSNGSVDVDGKFMFTPIPDKKQLDKKCEALRHTSAHQCRVELLDMEGRHYESNIKELKT